MIVSWRVVTLCLFFVWSFLFVGGGGLDCGTLCVFLTHYAWNSVSWCTPLKTNTFPWKVVGRQFFFGPSCLLGRAKNEAPTFHHSGSQNTLKKHPDCLGHVFFCWLHWELKRIQAIIPKKSILIKPRNARKKIVGNGIPKKIPFRLYKPRKSQKQKETCSKNTMGVSKKMVGFHKTTIGFSYPKDRSFWGGDWGNPPFKENTHMYLHEWLMCMVNGISVSKPPIHQPSIFRGYVVIFREVTTFNHHFSRFFACFDLRWFRTLWVYTWKSSLG